MRHELGDMVEVIDGLDKGAIGRVVSRSITSGPSGKLERYNLDVMKGRVLVNAHEIIPYVPFKKDSHVTDSYSYKVQWTTPKLAKACRCDSRDLFNFGCRCGAFKALSG